MGDVLPPLEERAPWVTQVKQDLRGDDLAMPLNDFVKSYRDTVKERETLKSEQEKIKNEYTEYKTKSFRPIGPDSKPEEVSAYRKALGVPDKPEGYTFKLPEGTPEDVLSPEELKTVLALAHKYNASPALVQELINYEANTVLEARKSIQAEQETEIKTTQEWMVKEWGDKVEQNLAYADKFTDTFGGEALRKCLNMTKVEGKTIGNMPELISAFSKAGKLLSESGVSMEGTGTGASVGTPDYKNIYKSSFAKGYMH
jgi:hypothetical protein